MTASTFSVYPFRFTPQPEAWRPFLETLGLAPRFASGIGFMMFEAGSGWVGIHPEELSATHAEPGETQLALLSLEGDGEDAAEAIKDLGLKAQLWDEEFGQQAGVIGPRGEGIWVNAKLKDTIGAGAPDPAVGVVAVRYSSDFAADTEFFSRLGFAAEDGGNEWWTALTAPGGGTVGLHKPSGDDDRTARPSDHNPIGAVALAGLGFTTTGSLEDLVARLNEAGYSAELPENTAGHSVHVTDPDGQVIEIHSA